MTYLKVRMVLPLIFDNSYLCDTYVQSGRIKKHTILNKVNINLTKL